MADNGTSPAYGPRLAAGQGVLWTYWAQWLPVPVVDQFYNPLNALYDGQDVFEYLNSTVGWVKINQQMKGGTYSDPVFVFVYKNKNGPYIVDESSPEAQQWRTAPPMPFPAGFNQTQNIRVQVAGFELQAVGADGTTLTLPAIQNRQLNATSPNNVNVSWP